jgi:2-keto-4-pentenoate hydratase/2-oxohepta-3-ene-1,7-dioic acid hydratase in catechol pathway
MDPPGLLRVGDLVEVEVEGLGKLANRVVAPDGAGA